ncbi:MAG: ABC transporter ATP-binding protein [Polyangiaceae bacterium]|nr:ABC transporter ATP-binding protein [Polyangiaceae bacterium]
MTPLGIRLAGVRVWREDGVGGDPAEVVHDVTVTIAPGRRVALVGANGAGKTSLLLALVGAARFAGTIQVGDLTLDRHSLSQVRASLGFVFAEPADQLFSATVRDEAAFAPRQRGLADADERAERELQRVGLSGLEARVPQSLSLGEQRRLAIAAVLSADPALLLLDEPTASLDSRSRRAVLDAIRASPATTVFATHDLEAALELEADVLVLGDGCLLGHGPGREQLADAALLDAAGLDRPRTLDAGRSTAPGAQGESSPK